MVAVLSVLNSLGTDGSFGHQEQLYDGWILRFSYFYTHRTNSVEQIGTSTIPLEEKINYCEDIYRHWGTPSNIQDQSAGRSGLDTMLRRGIIRFSIPRM